MAILGVPEGSIGVIGGTEVFGFFLDRYDVFYLSRAPAVRLPGGRPVFPEVPARTPEQVLARHGLEPHRQQLLDAEKGIAVVEWRRSAKNQIE
jgi:dihydrofolate reductase